MRSITRVLTSASAAMCVEPAVGCCSQVACSLIQLTASMGTQRAARASSRCVPGGNGSASGCLRAAACLGGCIERGSHSPAQHLFETWGGDLQPSSLARRQLAGREQIEHATLGHDPQRAIADPVDDATEVVGEPAKVPQDGAL
jgi:hypothetical protein